MQNTEPVQITQKTYKTILADPPWKVPSQCGKNNSRSAESHYKLMSLDRIKAMPIKNLAEENAHLYLWIPNGLLQEGLDVIKAWVLHTAQQYFGSNHVSVSATTSAMLQKRVCLPRGAKPQ